MRVVILSLTAAAIAVSTGAAFATPHPAEVQTVAMERNVERAPLAGAIASERTIFGHPLSQSNYVLSGRSLNVWGHQIDPGE